MIIINKSGNTNQENVNQREVQWDFTPLWYFLIANEVLEPESSGLPVH